jgi:hypothetical protein
VDCAIPGYERGELNLLLIKSHLEPEKEPWSLIDGWEPALNTTSCSTQWGQGSHYENAAFFDFSNELLAGIDYLSYDYSQAPSTTAEVTFLVDMTDVEIVDDVFVTGDFTGASWHFIPMESIGNNISKYSTPLQKGEERACILIVKEDWDTGFCHERLYVECAPMGRMHRKYFIENNTETYAYFWSSCESIPLSVETTEAQASFSVYPNSLNDQLNLDMKYEDVYSIQISTLDGNVAGSYDDAARLIDATFWQQGL